MNGSGIEGYLTVPDTLTAQLAGAYTRTGRTRKVPNGSTHGSCIYIDSEDSDHEENKSSAHSNTEISRAQSQYTAMYESVEVVPPGQSSLLMALSKLNEQWSDEVPPILRTSTPLGSTEDPVSTGPRSSMTNQSAGTYRTKDTATVHRIVSGVTTTLMIRNIPLRFTPVSLREVIDAEGFSGRYDYCYMPMDFRSHRSLGYCFINFYDAQSATEFVEKFDNRKFAYTNSEKVLSISAGARQGLLANVASFKLSTLKQMPKVEFRPVVAILGQLFPLDEDVYTWLLTGTTQNTIPQTLFRAPLVVPLSE